VTARDLAEAVKARRNDLRMFQEDLAAIADVSLGTIRNVEQATRDTYSGRTLRRLDDALVWTCGSAQRLLDSGEPPTIESQPRSDDERAIRVGRAFLALIEATR
jgi:transcriptional regulator with XRE-family HTH domain